LGAVTTVGEAVAARERVRLRLVVDLVAEHGSVRLASST
jgi:hypothetical protein